MMELFEVDAMDNRSNDHPPGLARLVDLAMRMQRYLIGDPRPQLTNAYPKKQIKQNKTNSTQI